MSLNYDFTSLYPSIMYNANIRKGVRMYKINKIFSVNVSHTFDNGYHIM